MQASITIVARKPSVSMLPYPTNLASVSQLNCWTCHWQPDSAAATGDRREQKRHGDRPHGWTCHCQWHGNQTDARIRSSSPRAFWRHQAQARDAGQYHDCRQKALGEHASVPDESRIGFTTQLLAGRATGNQTVKSTDGATGDRHEQKREDHGCAGRIPLSHGGDDLKRRTSFRRRPRQANRR